MTSTSCNEIAQDLLAQCVAGTPPSELPRALLEEPCGQALFGVLVEGLADRFEPSLCDAYAHLFSQAVAHVTEGVNAASMVARYERVRRPRPISGNPRQVYVLSRVTLGADVAITSVLLAAAKQRFPDAAIGFVGPLKNYELFARDPRIHHVPVAYQRGGLRHRLAVWEDLKTLLTDNDSVVIDPDSRLTQLGLLPVCQEDRYHLFESRAYGSATSCSLSELAASWAFETLGISEVKPYLSSMCESGSGGIRADQGVRPTIAVSLGVGENPAKRIAAPFEEKLLALLSETGLQLYIDKGAGGEEAERIDRAVAASGVRPIFWEGSFAGFASIIAGSRFYAGYDSAGQHVAVACGVPLISVFAGFPVLRMFERWRPTGDRCEVIRVDHPNAEDVLASVKCAIQRLLPVVS